MIACCIAITHLYYIFGTPCLFVFFCIPSRFIRCFILSFFVCYFVYASPMVSFSMVLVVTIGSKSTIAFPCSCLQHYCRLKLWIRKILQTSTTKFGTHANNCTLHRSGDNVRKILGAIGQMGAKWRSQASIDRDF